MAEPVGVKVRIPAPEFWTSIQHPLDREEAAGKVTAITPGLV
jgi:hypothetical protein